MKIKKGTQLEAIDECLMDEDYEPTLTIGQTYTVRYVSKHHFEIMDDKNEPHLFSYKEEDGINEYWKTFFKIKDNENGKV